MMQTHGERKGLGMLFMLAVQVDLLCEMKRDPTAAERTVRERAAMYFDDPLACVRLVFGGECSSLGRATYYNV